MTYPLIGNYGSTRRRRSRRPWVNGFIVKEAAAYPSSWRGRIPIETYMREHGIVGSRASTPAALHAPPAGPRRPEGIISTGEATLARRERARALPGCSAAIS